MKSCCPLLNSPQPGSWGKIKVLNCKGRWVMAPHVWSFLQKTPHPTAPYLNAVFVIICPIELGFHNVIRSSWSKPENMLGISLPLTIETHCLPSSIFIEHLQCTRHNRTYRKHCPCSGGAYILKEKNTPLVKWHFCLVFSVKYWGNSQ